MFNLGTVSYGIAAAAFMVLALLLLTSWRGRLQGALLVAAAAVTRRELADGGWASLCWKCCERCYGVCSWSNYYTLHRAGPV